MDSSNQKRQERSQLEIMRQWSLITLDRKRGKMLIHLWNSTAGRRYLLSAFRHWNMFVQLDIIVTAVKKHWLGYRVRYVSDITRRRVQYLRQFKKNIQRYATFRRRLQQRCVIRVLKLYMDVYVRTLREKRQSEILCARSLRTIMRRTLSAFQNRSNFKSAKKYLAVRGKRTVLRRFQEVWFLSLKSFEAQKKHKKAMIRNCFDALSSIVLVKNGLLLAEESYSRYRLLIGIAGWNDWYRIQRYCNGECIRRADVKRTKIAFELLQWMTQIKVLLNRKVRFCRIQQALRKMRDFFSKSWPLFVIRRQRARRCVRKAMFAFKQLKASFRFLLYLARKRKRGSTVHSMKYPMIWRIGPPQQNSPRRISNLVMLKNHPEAASVKESFKKFVSITHARIHRRSQQRRLLLVSTRDEWLLRYALKKMFRQSRRGRPSQRQKRLTTLKPPYRFDHNSSFRQSLRQNRVGITDNYSLRKILFPLDNSIQHRDEHSSRGVRRSSTNSMVVKKLHAARPPRNQQDLLLLRQQMLGRINQSDWKVAVHPLLLIWIHRARLTAKWKRRAKKLLVGFVHQLASNSVRHLALIVLKRRRWRDKVVAALKRSKRLLLKRYFHSMVIQFRRSNAALAEIRRWQLGVNMDLCAIFLRRLKRRLHFNGLLHNSLLCIRKLRRLLRLFIHKLKQKHRVVVRYRQRNATFLVSKQRMKTFLKKCRQQFKLRATRCQIKRLLRLHYLQYFARKLIHYWIIYATVRMRMRRIYRRFYTRNSVSLWRKAFLESSHSNYVVHRITQRVNKRLKQDSVLMWKLFTVRNSRITLQYNMLRAKVHRRSKLRALFAWMRVMDGQVNRAKFHAVCDKRRLWAIQRVFSLWHRLTVFAERCTWQSSKAAFFNWFSLSKNRSYLKLVTRKAATRHRYFALRGCFLHLHEVTLRSVHSRRKLRRIHQVPQLNMSLTSCQMILRLLE